MMVSVIIPNYNHAPYLKQRIDTVLNQTYQDFELIILDDCSTDASKEIIEQYRTHPKLSQIVYNSVNTGNTFKQWKKGIELAKGDWIWIAESDDWCEPSFLEEVLPKNKEAANNVSLSYCGSIMFHDNNIISFLSSKQFISVEDGRNFVAKNMISGNAVCNASMAIFKRSLVKNLDHIIEYTFCGDWLFWILIAQEGDVCINGKCLNYFRKHNMDVSGKKYNDGTFHAEYLRVQKFLLHEKYIDYKNYERNLLLNLHTIDNITKKEARKSILALYKNAIGEEHFFLKWFLYRLQRKLGFKIS